MYCTSFFFIMNSYETGNELIIVFCFFFYIFQKNNKPPTQNFISVIKATSDLFLCNFLEFNFKHKICFSQIYKFKVV